MRIPVYDVIYPNGTDAQKPHENNWCKQEPNPVGAIMLKGKQANEYGARNWNFHICKIIEFFRWQYHSKRQAMYGMHSADGDSSTNKKRSSLI
jgi:hypothetical protein